MLHTLLNLIISIFCVYGIYAFLCDIFRKVAYEALKKDSRQADPKDGTDGKDKE